VTTKELAEHHGVKITTVYQHLWKKGHFRGWAPVGYENTKRVGANTYRWEKS